MFEHPTEAQNAVAAENVKWFLDRRSRDPRFAQPPPPAMDSALAKQLAANTAAHAAKLSKVALRQRKAALFTTPYDKVSESLASCEKRAPGDFPSSFSQDDWIMIGKLALQRANEDLQLQGVSPITDKEAADISTFLAANDVYLGSDGALLVGFSVLVAEGIIRPQAAVQAAAEPVAERKNPFPYSDYSGSDYAKWDRSEMKRGFQEEHKSIFRAGAEAAAAELGGIEISTANMHRLSDKCDGLPFHEWSAERVKQIALRMFGGATAVTRDPEDSLSSLEYMQKHQLGNAVMREGK